MGNRTYFIIILIALVCVSCSYDASSFYEEDENKSERVNIIGDTIFFETEADLIRMQHQVAKEHRQMFLNKGWKEYKDTFSIEQMTRSASYSVKLDTIYTSIVSVEPTYVRFKARFGSEMVKTINAEVKPELRLSTNKTYLCHWDLLSPYYELAVNETAGIRNSPNCALKPETKTDYKERGYEAYVYTAPDGKRQFVMISYKLYIICEDVDHYTTTLDIDWPFPPKGDNGYGTKGYEFIYAVLAKN